MSQNIQPNKDFYIALLHHPVVDKNKQIITASVTNLDLHDIARSAATFGVKRYFVVHPSPDEQALNNRIVNHWRSGYGERSHRTRKEALEIIELVNDFETVLTRIQELSGEAPLKIGTSARKTGSNLLKIDEFMPKLKLHPAVLVFGTGYGLSSEWNQTLDFFLPPIAGPTDYNHLSVRSAVAIYLDRLFAIP